MSATETAAELRLDDVLPDDVHGALVERAADVVARSGLAASMASNETADLGESCDEFTAWLGALVPVLRTELGLDHFQVAGVNMTLTAHDATPTRRDFAVGAVSTATPRIGFVYTFGAVPDAVDGGVLRLLHERGADDDDPDVWNPDGERWTEYEPVDNSIVVFPADRHYEVTRMQGDPSCTRYTLTGFIAGDPVRQGPPPLDPRTLGEVQLRYLPRFSEAGYEVRPTPAPVQQLLEALLELRRDDVYREPIDDTFIPTGNPDFVEIQDVGDDLLRWLQPIHEEFAGVPLEPSNIYGLRVYREGNSLEMHVDRPEALVVSAVVQVAQDIDEPWPLVVEYDGELHDVHLSPGQMLLYEGATTMHGRPTPMRGREFVNVFVHYRPVDWPWDADEVSRRALADGLIDRSGRLVAESDPS